MRKNGGPRFTVEMHPTLVCVVAVLASLSGCAADDEPASVVPPPPAAIATVSETAPTNEDALPVGITVGKAGGESIEAGRDNDFAVAAAGGIWVTGVPPGLVRYEASTGEITRRIEIESVVVQALDAVDGRVWVVGLAPDVLLVVDEVSGEVVKRVALPAAPLVESSLGAHGDVAWVLINPAAPRILRVDTTTGELARLPAPVGVKALRYGAGSLWVTTYDSVERLDPRTGRRQDVVETVPSSSFLTFAHGAAWVLGQLEGSVSRVDARSGEASTIMVSDHAVNGGDIAASEGYVWVRTWDGVTVIDPGMGEAFARIDTEGGSGSVAAADGWLWITDHDHSAVHRVPWPPA